MDKWGRSWKAMTDGILKSFSLKAHRRSGEYHCEGWSSVIHFFRHKPTLHKGLASPRLCFANRFSHKKVLTKMYHVFLHKVKIYRIS